MARVRIYGDRFRGGWRNRPVDQVEVNLSSQSGGAGEQSLYFYDPSGVNAGASDGVVHRWQDNIIEVELPASANGMYVIAVRINDEQLTYSVDYDLPDALVPGGASGGGSPTVSGATYDCDTNTLVFTFDQPLAAPLGLVNNIYVLSASGWGSWHSGDLTGLNIIETANDITVENFRPDAVLDGAYDPMSITDIQFYDANGVVWTYTGNDLIADCSGAGVAITNVSSPSQATVMIEGSGLDAINSWRIGYGDDPGNLQYVQQGDLFDYQDATYLLVSDGVLEGQRARTVELFFDAAHSSPAADISGLDVIVRPSQPMIFDVTAQDNSPNPRTVTVSGVMLENMNSVSITVSGLGELIDVTVTSASDTEVVVTIADTEAPSGATITDVTLSGLDGTGFIDALAVALPAAP